MGHGGNYMLRNIVLYVITLLVLRRLWCSGNVTWKRIKDVAKRLESRHSYKIEMYDTISL
jgi:hypothetical protein